MLKVELTPAGAKTWVARVNGFQDGLDVSLITSERYKISDPLVTMKKGSLFFVRLSLAISECGTA
jgi:hypothetical protein